MNWKFIFILTILLSLFLFGKSQTTITLQPDAAQGQDAFLHGEPSRSNLNLGNYHLFASGAWTWDGTTGIIRSAMNFDLSSIPAGATIISAELSLYSTDGPPDFGKHSTLSGPNDSWLQRITSTWDESTITWNTQPSVTTTNQVALAASSSDNQNYLNIDVSNLVQDMINDPSNSFGFMISQADENIYRIMSFASSDFEDSTLHPKLVITLSETCLTLQPDSTQGQDAFLHGEESRSNINLGNYPLFASGAWTWDGNPGTIRSLLNFDISSIPPTARITSAKLSLFSTDGAPDFGQHSTLSGSNEGWLQRITSSWNESTVTWNTQPSTTSINQVPLAASTSSNQDYLDIDVKDLVQDMVNDPANSFGFMLSLQNENFYRILSFASSDFSDSDLHPKIEICYTKRTPITENIYNHAVFDLYPNPANHSIQISINSFGAKDISIEIMNSQGQVVKSIVSTQPEKEVDISDLAAGMYYVRVKDRDKASIRKLVVE